MIGPDFWLISNEMSAPYEENGHAAIYIFFLSLAGWPLIEEFKVHLEVSTKVPCSVKM